MVGTGTVRCRNGKQCDFSFPTASTRPVPFVGFCSRRLPSRRTGSCSRPRQFRVPLSARFPTVSCPTECPAVPIPSRRSHTVSPIPFTHLFSRFPITWPWMSIGFCNYDYGCNTSSRGDWRLQISVSFIFFPGPLPSPTLGLASTGFRRKGRRTPIFDIWSRVLRGFVKSRFLLFGGADISGTEQSFTPGGRV